MNLSIIKDIKLLQEFPKTIEKVTIIKTKKDFVIVIEINRKFIDYKEIEFDINHFLSKENSKKVIFIHC